MCSRFINRFPCLQVFTCGNSTHLLRQERNAVTAMLCFMSVMLSSNIRRLTKMRSVSSVTSVTIAADRFALQELSTSCCLCCFFCLFVASEGLISLGYHLTGTPHDNAQAYTHRGKALCLQPV